MADIFISCAGGDRDWALWIAKELAAVGHTPHVHAWEVKGGDDILAWMEQRHDTADHLLCVVSDDYIKGPLWALERHASLRQTAGKRPGFVLFVVVQPCRLPALGDYIRRCEIFGLSEEMARVRLRAFMTAPAAAPEAVFPGMASPTAPPPSVESDPNPKPNRPTLDEILRGEHISEAERRLLPRTEGVDREWVVPRSELRSAARRHDRRSIEEARRYAADADTDIVEVSAFAPLMVAATKSALVQIVLHRADDDAQAVAALAREADPETERRGIATLTTEVTRGQSVGIVLDAPGLEVDEPMQTVPWRGLPRSSYFLVQAPADAADRVYHVRARVLLASVPVGMLRFTLRGAAAEQPVDAARTIRGEWAQRYRYAFLSYASGDRAEVLKRAQALKAAHIDFFNDLLTLEPGERWERRLYEEIDRCDLFLLFWSSGAARSEWVVREAEYALHRSETSAERIPDIAPVMIEGPPIPRPPDSLKHLHFNDPLCYVIATVQSEQPARP